MKRAVQRTMIRVLCFSVAVVNYSGGAFADGASPTPSTAVPNMPPYPASA